MELLEELTSLSEIESTLNSIPDEVIEIMGAKLKSVGKGEKTLGVVHSGAIKRLYVVSRIFSNRMSDLRNKAEMMAEGLEEESVIAEAHKCDVLEDLAKELLMAQLRIEFGAYGLTVAIRKNWMVVSFPRMSDNPLAILQGIIRPEQE